MNARTWMTATALAVAVTSIAPALVDGASAATPTHGVGTAVTLHKVHGKVVHTADRKPTGGIGIGSAITLHKVHGKVVHVHHHHKH